MTAHYDPSSLGDWPIPLWALTLAVAVAVAYLAAGPLVHRAPTQTPDTSTLDALDGVKPVKACTVPLCDDPVSIHLHVGHEWWTFCMAHGMPYLTDGLRDRKAS